MTPAPVREPGFQPVFPLGLVDDETLDDAPVGFVVALPAALDLLRRLRPRMARYRTLRLALAADEAVLFATEPALLPWTGAARLYLRAEGALILPYGRRLDAPARWRGEIARRLLDARGLKAPALLLPRGSSLGIVDLAPSRALIDLDVDALAAQAG